MKLPPYPQLGTAGDAHPLPTQTYGNYASWAEPPQRKTGKDWSWHPRGDEVETVDGLISLWMSTACPAARPWRLKRPQKHG